LSRRRLLLVLVLVVAGGAAGAAAVIASRRADSVIPVAAGDSIVHAPEGVRIKVQVLNATATRGLARRATLLLRDRGFDVVEIGTAPDRRDSTLVLTRSGNAEWSRLVAAALGDSLAAVEDRPDSSRYLDVTVLLGRSWNPPAEPFYP
jgi:hypothetical protein